MVRDHRLRVFTTADLVTLADIRSPAATQALRRLSAQGLMRRIKRGVWVSRFSDDVHPYEAVAHLAAPWPAYVSLHSVLADCGVVEEIPQVIFVVSSGRPRRYETALGSFHVHHLPQRLIWGYAMRPVGPARCPVAEPEKAFLDLAYLALIPRSPIRFPHRRGRRWDLNRDKLLRYAKRFRFRPLGDYLRKNAALFR